MLSYIINLYKGTKYLISLWICISRKEKCLEKYWELKNDGEKLEKKSGQSEP